MVSLKLWRIMKKLYLEESSLTSLSNRVDTILVQAAWRGYGGVVVHLVAAVHGPVVVAVVVHIAVTVVHQPVCTGLLGQSTLNINRRIFMCSLCIDYFA